MEALGAEILYMIQGNIASSFMGRFAGIVLILPECGEIANVLITPELYTRLGIRFAFFVGFLTCLASSIACVMLYLQFIHHRKKN